MLVRQGWNSLQETHSSLLQKYVNYGQIKFYNIGPRLLQKKHLLVKPTAFFMAEFSLYFFMRVQRSEFVSVIYTLVR